MLDAGLRMLDFLNAICYRDGYLMLIGCQGWYPYGGMPALFDQQPIDAGCMVEANLFAYRITGNMDYFGYAVRAMDWFYGENILQLPLYNELSGGCHDGLQSAGINANQGAESTLAFLLSLAEMRLVQNAVVVFPEIAAA
jgi:hypothetical protein